MSISSNARLFAVVALAAGCGYAHDADQEEPVASQRLLLEAAPNDRGFAESFDTSGTIDHSNPFFTPDGGNGRTCETCHHSDQGWSITPDAVSALFDATQGLAPLFMTIDEGSSRDADLSTLSLRRKAFNSTLLSHGVTRFDVNIRPDAEFTVIKVDDPSGGSTASRPVVFRRPASIANETKVAQVTWTVQPSDFGLPDVASLLGPFAAAAAQFHQQIAALPGALAGQMVDFQLGLFFAQSFDADAGALDAAGARGGPAFLASQPFYVGINDIQGNDPQGHAFTRKVFDIYDAWANADADKSLSGAAKKQAQARASIYRGQEIFNFRTFTISGVNGLNDVVGQASVEGTCSTCHNAPNVGGHSVPRFFDTGTANVERCLADYPVMTLQNNTTQAKRKVCDTGRAGALIPTGRWADVGAFRAPPLRGLAGRSPYFHDGQASSIDALIAFYVQRFKIKLSNAEKVDLGNFLEAL